MSNTSSCNKDFREWSESIMTRTQELIKKLKETQRDLQWQYDMELHRLESEVKKKEEAIDDLNSSLFEMVQMNTDKDKQIEALQEEIKWLKTPKVLPVEKTLNVEMLTPLFDIHAELVRQLSEYRARQIENELIKLPKEFTVKGKIEWIKKPDEEKLEVGKWYDARTFKVEELKKLLPVGTLVAIVTDGIVDEKRNKPEGDRSIIVHSTVTSVESEVAGWDSEETVIYVERYQFVSNNWFKIIEEY